MIEPKHPTVRVVVTATDSVRAVIGRIARAMPTDEAAGEWTAAAWSTRPGPDNETPAGAMTALLRTAAGFVVVEQA